ncbi:hypothetical protein SELMODRAFT_127153 [Selaginella moellendorffii]|uniref:Pentacotripeptide-repeat region of PRORP domain-containing protein n=1 Tax=Selaginella moellendorffii TaxID=88036 RepID=D8SXF5_SELML|nr:hypothetical protein SELMODRAFT_127153 [Selaginella moellendorffii]
MSNGSSTIAVLLRECGISRDLARGRQLHSQILGAGYRSTVLENSLVRMYGDCGSLDEAVDAFSRISSRNVFSWNILLSAFAQRGHLDFARTMLEILPEFDTSMPFHDIVSWNAMIFAAAGTKESFVLFRRMQLEGTRPTYVTYATMIDSCAEAAALGDGRAIHERILQLGYFPGILVICNALINFYSRCGAVEEALGVFQSMRRRDLITWSTIVSGYAWNGLGERSAQLFQCMLLEGLDPSSVTLVNVLTSCSHGGLLDFGRRLFVFVTAEVPGFPVCREHYDCLVDLLGRSGRLEEALELMESMPFEPTALGRMSFAASCRKQHLEGDLNSLYEDTNYMALKGA